MNVLFFLKPKASVAYIYDNNTVRQGLEKMKHYGYTAIPVIDHEGRYVGTVTEGDFLWKLTEASAWESHAQERLNVPIGIPFTGKELAAYEAEGGQVKIIGVYVLPPADILIMLRHVAVERGKGMGRQAGGVIILDEFCEGYGLLLLVLPEHAAPETLHDTR